VQRSVSVLAFTLAFTGVIALAAGWSMPAASGDRAADAYGARLAPGGAQPFTATRTTIAETRSRLYLINVAVSPDTLPANPSHTSFGTLMPDGTWCGVGCRSTATNH
jgi:hypothetical protein